MSPESSSRNVAAQATDPGSILAHYRRLIWLRRSNAALSVGSYEEVPLGDESVYGYTRRSGRQAALVVLGFDTRAVPIVLPPSPSGRRWHAELSTHAPLPAAGDRFELRPLEAVIFVDD